MEKVGIIITMKVREIKLDLVTVILGGVAIIGVTTSVLGLINQRNLNKVIEMQSAKIDGLIKTKKDLQFGKELNNDSSITSIEELKKMVIELRERNNVLGTTAVAVGDTTLPPMLGIVTLNSGVSSVNIYDNPTTGANIISNTLPTTVVFYYQKQPGWHQIEFTTDKLGWIPDELITEMSQ